MPRSGSTLTEQILASHPLVHGADENNYLKQAINSVAPASSGAHAFPEMAIKLDSDDYRKIADNYLSMLRKHHSETRHITDKMLDNFIYTGLIKLLFPNARILHCKRNPLDTCFSCYRQLFGGHAPYSYDLAELAEYYKLYNDLMNHWQQVLEEPFLDIYYEDIILDTESQTRKILNYCNLPWDNACMEFHRSKRTVKTSSLAQVRKPIYKSAINSWEPYQNHLETLTSLLEEEVARYKPLCTIPD